MTKRRHLDAYYTPEKATLDLLHNCGISFNNSYIFEPCSGDNSIARTIEFYADTKVITNDIDNNKATQYHFDATNLDEWRTRVEVMDWVITNPPFNQAFTILQNAYYLSNKGVVFLLRLSFLEPTFERGDWLQLHPPNQVIVLPRISFTGDGKTDSVTTAWMIWHHGADHSLKYPSGIKIISKGSK